MTFLELVNELKALFEPIHLEEYDGEFGYIVRSSAEIARVGYATNLDHLTAAGAVEARVDALLTHHDAWDFLYELRMEALTVLESAMISHCYVHLPLDAAPFGTAETLAGRLGLEVQEGFARCEGLPCGRICAGPHPMPVDELARRLAEVMGCRPRVWPNRSREVHRIGITTGAGNLTDALREAAHMGCDTYITGETNLYSVQYARYRNLNLIVGTHTHTEFPGVERLCTRLSMITGLEFIPIREECFEIGATLPGGEHPTVGD